MPQDKLTLEHIIDIHIRGATIDDLRDQIAMLAYKSVLGEQIRTGGVRTSGGSGSPDDMMINIAEKIPKRYANSIIDQINVGFKELRSARPVRYDAVIYNHLGIKSRSEQSEELGLTLNQYKNEVSLGREYLSVRFMTFLV